MENRRFQRLRYSAQGDLSHNEVVYHIRLENISRGGALITSDECLMVLPGESCTLTLGLEGGDLPLTATVEVVHSFFSMVGVKFLAFERDGQERLLELLQRLEAEAAPNMC